eukprot:5753220-Prymnesium_polylepis.1
MGELAAVDLSSEAAEWHGQQQAVRQGQARAEAAATVFHPHRRAVREACLRWPRHAMRGMWATAP